MLARLVIVAPIEFRHSGNIGDGSSSRCPGCGCWVDCYVHEGPSGDESPGHELVCTAVRVVIGEVHRVVGDHPALRGL